MRKGLCWLLMFVCGMAAQFSPAADESLDAKDTDEAALMVAMEIATWDGWRRECSQAMPADARNVAGYYFHWLEANQAAILGMRAYAEHEKKNADAFEQFQQMQQPAVVDNASRRVGRTPQQVCVLTLGRLKDGEFDFARKYPGAAQMLARYVAAHPLSSQGARGYYNPTGCTKTVVQANVDYEAASKACRCAWDSTRNALTEAEWREYEAASATKTLEEVNALPQTKRMLPMLAACKEKFAPG